jgi:hypothetical protein
MFPTSLKGSVCCGGLWVLLRSRASIFVFGVIFDSHPPENSSQLDSIATPKSGVANGLRRVECWWLSRARCPYLPTHASLTHRRPPVPPAATKENEHARPHRNDEESATREQRRGEGARFPACRSR